MGNGQAKSKEFWFVFFGVCGNVDKAKYKIRGVNYER